jgi:trimeric autotransporter adhesin
VLIADTDDGRIRVVADSTGTFYGQAMTAGDIYTIAGGGTAGLGDGGPATEAKLDGPAAVATDQAGNVLIADTGNDRVREVFG